MRKLLVAIAGLIVIAALVGYGVFVADWFAPRSGLHATLALTRSYSIETADLGAIAVSARQKYGPQAEAGLKAWTGLVEITVDGKLVETLPIKGRIVGLPGIVAVGSAVPSLSRFPFRLVLEGSFHDDESAIGKFLRARFAETAPPWLLAFAEPDWHLAFCRQTPSPIVGIGVVSRLLGLGPSYSCLVEWRGAEPATMLVGAVVAEGASWIRLAARRTCRSLARSWVAALPAGTAPPNYVGCLLVYAPGNISGGTRGSVASHFFEVRADGVLAVIDR